MDQELIKRKDKRRLRTLQILYASFFGFILFLLILLGAGTRLNEELSLDGRVILTFQDRGSILVLLNNKIVTGSKMANQLGGKLEFWDRITKIEGSNELIIYRENQVIELKLNLQNPPKPK
jgi:hypothetical protein